MINQTIRTYSNLILLSTFQDRLRYLQLKGQVGNDTFGFDRYMNQMLYQRSKQWKQIRDYVIVRDNGCDLGIQDHPILRPIYIHHMNPITVDDIKNSTDFLFNPQYLISTSLLTHNAIHYGTKVQDREKAIQRSPNDTIPWRKIGR